MITQTITSTATVSCQYHTHAIIKRLNLGFCYHMFRSLTMINSLSGLMPYTTWTAKKTVWHSKSRQRFFRPWYIFLKPQCILQYAIYTQSLRVQLSTCVQIRVQFSLQFYELQTRKGSNSSSDTHYNGLSTHFSKTESKF
jgi:hypothetical protein